MYLTIKDVTDFVNGWYIDNKSQIENGLSDKQIADFLSELQEKISQMDFNVPEGTTIIGYSGKSKTRTLKGHYVIRRNTDGKWQFADYKSNYEVLDSEVYTAYPIDY